MTKRALLSAMTIFSACAVDPKDFGATAESSDTSAEESGECTDECAIALEWELPLLGAPLTGAIENSGSLLYIERDENGAHWLARIASDGNDREVFADISPLALGLSACGDVIVTTEVQGGGYRMQRFVDGEPDPTWMTTTTAHAGGWPAQMRCADDGTIRIVGNDTLDEAPTIYLDVIDAGELVATWSRPFDRSVDEVALLGESVPAVASEDVLIWAYSNDWEADLHTAEIIRLGPDLVELATSQLDLGHDHAQPPIPSGDGWLLAGNSDSGPWVQQLDAAFAPQGPRVVDSAALAGGVTRARGLPDGSIVLAVSNPDDPTHPQLRRYDTTGSLLSTSSLAALTENTQGTLITTLLRDGNDIVVLGMDATLDEHGGNGIPRGWLRRYSFD